MIKSARVVFSFCGEILRRLRAELLADKLLSNLQNISESYKKNFKVEYILIHASIRCSQQGGAFQNSFETCQEQFTWGRGRMLIFKRCSKNSKVNSNRVLPSYRQVFTKVQFSMKHLLIRPHTRKRVCVAPRLNGPIKT